MNLESLLKDSTIADFICNSCNNVLSYFPIYLTSDCQNVCGRCTPPLGNLHFRNRIYEHLSQTVKFPCRFKNQGCHEQLLPEEVPSHETTCKFRTIHCSFTQCKWEGLCPDFLLHCKDTHQEMFLADKETFDLDLSNSFHIIKLLKNENMVFVCEMKFEIDEKKLQVAVYYPRHEIDIDCNYQCQLSLQTGTSEHVDNFKTTKFKDISFTELIYPNFKNNLSCCISIVKATTTRGGEDKGKQTTKELNPDLLSLLKCLSCKVFAMPPIYQCEVAKSALCSSCNENHNNCYNCSRDRNITLDKLASLLNFPCKNNEAGCNFVGVPSEMEKHFGICQYEAISCALMKYDCAWSGRRKDIEDHIQNQHRSFIHRHFSLVFEPSVKCFLLEGEGNRLFFAEYVREKKRFCWRVQMIGGERDEIFEYQLEISNTHFPHQAKMLINKKCSHQFDNRIIYDYMNIDQVGQDARFKVTIL